MWNSIIKHQDIKTFTYYCSLYIQHFFDLTKLDVLFFWEQLMKAVNLQKQRQNILWLHRSLLSLSMSVTWGDYVPDYVPDISFVHVSRPKLNFNFCKVCGITESISFKQLHFFLLSVDCMVASVKSR